MRHVVVNLLGSKLAEYLLYYIATLETIPDAVQGKLFQRRDIVLERIQCSFSHPKEVTRNLVCESIN